MNSRHPPHQWRRVDFETPMRVPFSEIQPLRVRGHILLSTHNSAFARPTKQVQNRSQLPSIGSKPVVGGSLKIETTP